MLTAKQMSHNTEQELAWGPLHRPLSGQAARRQCGNRSM